MKVNLTADRALLAESNICPDTGLATDYLNHFNEAAMMLEMAADMPELAAELLEWRPCSYADHFHNTGFRAKELAVAAYEACAPDVRRSFEAACRRVEAAILDASARIEEGVDPRSFASAAAADIYDRIAYVGAIILGHPPSPSGDEQAAVDALFD